MKITFISRLYLPHIGGVERHLSGLCSQLSDHQITVITEKYDSSLETYEHQNGVEIHRIPTESINESEKKWAIWHWINKHQSILNEADIIHVHDVFFWLYWYKLTHPLKKIYTTFHGWEGSYPIPIKNIFHKNLASLLSNGTICVGDYISKWYGITPDFVTYGATDLVRDLPLESRGRSQRELLFLGRLDHDTGFEACLKKYHALKQKMNWTLSVAGDGPLRSLAPTGVKLLGFVQNPKALIHQADYVFTTGYLGILESFAQKKVVLSYYNNPVKRDYLLTHPMSKYIVFDNDIPRELPIQPFQWANQQTFAKLAKEYLELWTK